MPVFQRRISTKSMNQLRGAESANHGVGDVVEGAGEAMQRAKNEAEGCIADYFERTNSDGRLVDYKNTKDDMKKKFYRQPITVAAIGVGFGFLISSLLRRR